MPEFRARVTSIAFVESWAVPLWKQGGGVSGAYLHTESHFGGLRNLSGIENLPPTQPPYEQLAQAQETAMSAVLDGCVGSLPDQFAGRETLSPPTDTVYSWETPSKVYCALPPNDKG